jgi:NTE family protein
METDPHIVIISDSDDNHKDEPLICEIGEKEYQCGKRECNNVYKGLEYDSLCLEGGGVLGISYCGGLYVMHVLNVLAGMKNFAGSSAGSIVAAALACGASFNFLYTELSELNITKFLDYGNKVKALYNLYYHYGFCPGDALMIWFESFLEKLTKDRDITFRQVHEIYGGKLVITGTRLGKNAGDMTEKSCVYFSHETYPDMPIKVALRISTSIPILFQPYFYDGYYWADGGILDNYPIRAFHKNTPNNDKINPKTIGMMLMTNKDELVGTPPITSIYTYLQALISCYLNQQQKTHIDEQDWIRTIKIQCGNISSMNFEISEKEKEYLVKQGELAVREYMEKQV